MYALASLAVLISFALFIAAAFLTRAGLRRISAALVGGTLAALLNIGWDVTAARMGWWRYLSGSAEHAAWVLYVPVVFWFGAGLGLIGWRAMRAWGTWGTVLFLTLYVLAGSARDHLYAARGGVFVFWPGAAPRIADAAGWASLALIVQLAMLVLAGPPRADALRGS